MEKTFFDSLPVLDLETILASAKDFSNTSTEDNDEPQEIWLVHHHHRDGLFNWCCAFDNEEAAEDFLNRRIELYSMQDAYIEEDGCGDVFIAKDEDATVVVRMYIESVYINCPNCGTVIL